MSPRIGQTVYDMHTGVADGPFPPGFTMMENISMRVRSNDSSVWKGLMKAVLRSKLIFAASVAQLNRLRSLAVAVAED